MAVFFGGVTLLIALIVTPGWLFYFDVTPKLVILLVGTALTCCWIALSKPHKLAQPGKSRDLRIFGRLLAAAAAWLALTTVLSLNRSLSAFGTNWRRFGAIAQLALLLFAWLSAHHTAGRPDRVRTILRFIAAAAAISGLYGICQYFGWDPLLPRSAYHIGEGVWTIVRPPGTLGYVSYFATWLVGSAFLCGLLAGMESGWLRLAALLCGAIALIAMLLTGTRAAMFGLAVGLVVSIAMAKRLPRKTIGIGILGMVVVGAFYFSPPGLQMRSRTRWFTEDPWGGSRLLLWRDGLKMASHRLAVGYGPEGFTSEFPAFESVELARAYPDFVHESPHNIFVDALISEGIPGCALLLAICGFGLWLARKNAALAGALTAVLVAQQFTVFVIPTALLLFLIVTLAVAAHSDPVEQRTSIPVRIAAAALAALLIVCALRYGAADRELALTQRSLARQDMHAAAAHYSTYDRLRLPGTSAALWYSQALFSLAIKTANPVARVQAMAQSGAAALRATSESEDPCNAWYNVAELYAAQNNRPRTEAALESAIAAHPRWFKPHWILAQVLLLSARPDEARRQAEIAVDLNGGKNPEVAATLRQIRATAKLQ